MAKKIKCIISVILLLINNGDAQELKDYFARYHLPEDGRLNFTQLVMKHGIFVEEFKVISEDGYILKIFHIPSKKNVTNRLPVFLLHGMANSADDFVLRGNKSLALTLSSAGYDIWIGNTRGNRYSRRHKYLHPDRDVAFWDYSAHETGLHDTAAFVDFILTKTGQEKLSAIGHSQGNTDFLILGSLKPEYNERVSVMIALGPVAFLNGLQPPMSYVIDVAPFLIPIMEVLGFEEFFSDTDVKKIIIELFCSKLKVSYEFCANGFFFSFGGFDPGQFEREFLPVLIGHYPQGCSKKTLLHMAQIAKSRRFSQFDYGPVRNSLKYKSRQPPEYNLLNVTMNVAILVGRNDKLSTVKDAETLRDRLPNVVYYKEMEPDLWNHLDWVWGTEMDKYLYPHIFKLLKSYS